MELRPTHVWGSSHVSTYLRTTPLYALYCVMPFPFNAEVCCWTRSCFSPGRVPCQCPHHRCRLLQSALESGKMNQESQVTHLPINCAKCLFILRCHIVTHVIIDLLCSTARIVRTKQWCEMIPCLEDEGCDLLVNKSGWTCTQPGGRVKTTTVSVLATLIRQCTDTSTSQSD